MRVPKSRFGFVLHLIGREKREFFFKLVTGRNKAKQLQSRINFDCQLNGAQFYGQAKLNSDIEFKWDLRELLCLTI